jgi:hypothetical protein
MNPNSFVPMLFPFIVLVGVKPAQPINIFGFQPVRATSNHGDNFPAQFPDEYLIVGISALFEKIDIINFGEPFVPTRLAALENLRGYPLDPPFPLS